MTGKPYLPSDRLWDLIDENSKLLMAISRFGIPLGFGNATVEEVCVRNNIHEGTFLAVVNYLSGKKYDATLIDLRTLIDYLKGSHTYFLEFLLPSIRRKLIEAVNYGNSSAEISMLLLKFFDEYVEEIHQHMTFENEHVFEDVSRLIDGQASESGVLQELFTDRHDNVARKLRDLKDVIVRYYPRRNSDLINSALCDIINCEKEILDHCGIEDSLFEPAIRKEMESRMGRYTYSKQNTAIKARKNADLLSDREKEIIKYAALGLSNKEIAEKLFLSVHTVTTHRRNISAKLNIHSPAALTIYAIINHIVEMDDIRTSLDGTGK